jgi:hypothetical protein
VVGRQLIGAAGGPSEAVVQCCFADDRARHLAQVGLHPEAHGAGLIVNEGFGQRAASIRVNAGSSRLAAGQPSVDNA